MIAARISAVVAAATWFVGTPLMALAGVIPSDAEYFWMGAIGALFGLNLAPVALTIGGSASTQTRTIVRAAGLTVCTALAVFGAALILGVQGRMDERAPSWIPGGAVVALMALFVWIGLASYTLRGPSTVARFVFWLGVITSASCLVLVVTSIFTFYFFRGSN